MTAGAGDIMVFRILIRSFGKLRMDLSTCLRTRRKPCTAVAASPEFCHDFEVARMVWQPVENTHGTMREHDEDQMLDKA
jgi:hypothetical protein